MIYILSWTTKKHKKTLCRPLHSKLKKLQGLFKTVRILIIGKKNKNEQKKLSTFQTTYFVVSKQKRTKKTVNISNNVCRSQ